MTIQGTTTYTLTGKTLANAGRSSYGGKSWDTAREIMKDTFQSISASESTSPSEKALADLGLRVGNHTMTSQNAAEARYTILQTISGAVSGPIGAVLAQSALNAYAGKSWDSARAILKDGLETVQTYSPDSNDQAVASLGIKFGDRSVTSKEAAEARYAATKVIAKGSAGDRGEVLAQTTLNAYGGKSWDTARAMTRDGLDAIANDSQTSAEQKTLANLGLTFGNHTMTSQNAAEARQTVLKKLSDRINTSLTDAICDVTLSAYGGKTWDSARAILKDGFDAVLSNPNATADEKELAKLGIEVGSNHMTDQAAATARRSVMRQLHDL